MPDTLRARQGDTLDGLLWRERGLRSADLAPVLEANPGLAALGPVLPTGTAVLVPDTAPAPVTRDLVQLWD
jgi:phage tail protein X